MGVMNREDTLVGNRILRLIGDLWECKAASQDDVEILVRALDNPDPIIRSGAAIALGNIFGGNTFLATPNSMFAKLKNLYLNDPDEDVRKDAEEAQNKILNKTMEKNGVKMPRKRESAIIPPVRKALPGGEKLKAKG